MRGLFLPVEMQTCYPQLFLEPPTIFVYGSHLASFGANRGLANVLLVYPSFGRGPKIITSRARPASGFDLMTRTQLLGVSVGHIRA